MVGGLVLVTAERSGAAIAAPVMVRAGLLWGVLSGMSYAVGAIGFVEAAGGDGWWPTVGQRVAAMILLFSIARATGVRPLPPRGQWANGVMTGVVSAAISLLYLASLTIDPTVGVVAISAFPAFSVLIGRVFFADPVRGHHAAGIALVVAGVAAVSVG